MFYSQLCKYYSDKWTHDKQIFCLLFFYGYFSAHFPILCKCFDRFRFRAIAVQPNILTWSVLWVFIISHSQNDRTPSHIHKYERESRLRKRTLTPCTLLLSSSNYLVRNITAAGTANKVTWVTLIIFVCIPYLATSWIKNKEMVNTTKEHLLEQQRVTNPEMETMSLL